MSRKDVRVGVTSGPTTILNTSRVLEARNLSTEQLDTLDQGEDIARSTQIQDEDYYDINDFRNPPPPPLPLLEEMEISVDLQQDMWNLHLSGILLPSQLLCKHLRLPVVQRVREQGMGTQYISIHHHRQKFLSSTGHSLLSQDLRDHLK